MTGDIPATNRFAWLRDERVVTAVVLVGILLVALTVRLYRLPDLMVVGGDQSRDALVVDHMLHTGQPVLQGSVASTGTFHRGPAYYYLLAGAYLLSGDDPIGGALLSVVADMAALLIAFVMVRGVAGNGAALVTAGLWAVSPWLIHFARFQWNPIVMVPFALLSVYAAIRIARGDGRWLLVLAPAWLIGWQNHELASFLVPMLALVLVWHWRVWLKPRIVAGAFALSLLVMLPFIVQQLTHRFEDVRAMLGYLLDAALGRQVPSVNGQGLPSATDRVNTAVSWMLRALPEQPLLNLVFVALAALGLAWLFWRIYRERSPDAAVLVLYSLTPLLYAFWPSPIFSHYTLLVQPIPLILCGAGVAALIGVARQIATRVQRPRLGSAAVAGAAAAIALVVGLGLVGSLNATAAEPPVARRWQNVQAVTRGVIADAGGQPFALRIKADFFPYISWKPMWEYPFEYAHAEPDPLREDLPTYVIFDPADYAAGANYGGQVVDGVRWARFPTPTFGEQILGGAWQFGGTGSGELSSTTTPQTIRLVANAARAYAEATQTVPVTVMTRYMVRYDYITEASAGAISVYLQVFDVNGTLLDTLPNGGGDRHGPSATATTASFIDEIPTGGVSARLIVRWTGVGNAWYSNVELRPVVTEAPW